MSSQSLGRVRRSASFARFGRMLLAANRLNCAFCVRATAVQAFYRLQPNLYVTSQWSGIVNIPVVRIEGVLIDSQCWLRSLVHLYIAQNTFYPILWSEVATQVTKDMAFTMSENIYLPSRVRPYAFWVRCNTVALPPCLNPLTHDLCCNRSLEFLEDQRW